MEENYLPPDSDDVCWEEGAVLFTRREVWYLLYTQRAMISNDIKSSGTPLTAELLSVIENPRKPKY